MALTNASFLPDEVDCAEIWRRQRWPEGVRYVSCGSNKIQCRTQQYRDCLGRYRCQDCDKWFNDLTDTPLEYSKVSLGRWVYLLHDLDKGRPMAEIAQRLR